MAQGKTMQRPAIAIASLAFHALILTGLTRHQAHLAATEEIFTVTVLPRYLTPKESQHSASPQQQVSKKDRPRELATIPPPILQPPPSPISAQPIQPPLTITAQQLGQALRNGGVGCNPPGLPGLSREARDICEARLAAGARNAGYLGNGLARDKQAGFDVSATAKARWRDNGVPVGMGYTDVSAEAALRRNQNAPGRPGDGTATWIISKTPN
ncbi:MAG: hypothetical protein CGW95_15210 [Phenylobacterium zucineum]|nr:MAG: hypothetical protein CGW95_15210 [Phenylobacterium zucineum]